MQKSPLCKLSVEREKCGCNFNKFNVFVKASNPSICVSESTKPKRTQVRKAKAFLRQQKRSIKPEYKNLNSFKEVCASKSKSEGITYNLSGKKCHVMAYAKGDYWWIMA